MPIKIQKPFYGWYIAFVGFLSIFVGVGATIDAIAVFVKPMSESLGWSRTLIMVAVTVGAITTALVSPLVGRVIDRVGARLLMPISAVIGGGFLAAISLVTQPWQFFLLFGIGLGVTRPCFSFVAATTTVSNWFILKRGRALALTTMGAAISAMLVIPLTQYIVTEMDWRSAWISLGIMVIGLLALPSAIIIRRRPEDVGLLPDGAITDKENSNTDFENNPTAAKAEVNWTLNQARRTPAFWLILVSQILISLPLIGTWLHASASFTDRGVSAAGAALAMGSVAFTSVPSRIVFGLIVEKIHVRYCIIVTNIGLCASVLLIMTASSFATALFSMLFYGVFVGGGVVLQALVWPDYFGRKALGSIQGYTELFRVIGVAGGPLLAGFIYDITGSYYIPFSIFAAGCLLATYLMYMARQPVLPEY